MSAEDRALLKQAMKAFRRRLKLTRLDDGVLGFFVDDDYSRFRPVDQVRHGQIGRDPLGLDLQSLATLLEAQIALRIKLETTSCQVGGDFGRRHAAAYADAGIAKVSFGCSVWALDFLLDRGGSAYLPERIALPWCENGRLFRLPQAPVFTRNAYLITNDAVAEAWPWLANLDTWITEIA